MADVPAEIRIGNLPHTNLERCPYVGPLSGECLVAFRISCYFIGCFANESSNEKWLHGEIIATFFPFQFHWIMYI
jgi:hypothetical protein